MIFSKWGKKMSVSREIESCNNFTGLEKSYKNLANFQDSEMVSLRGHSVSHNRLYEISGHYKKGNIEEHPEEKMNLSAVDERLRSKNYPIRQQESRC